MVTEDTADVVAKRKAEYVGIWWLPQQRERQLTGTLTFEVPGRLILDLLGSFQDLSHFVEDHRPAFILGFSTTGKPITLYKCAAEHGQLTVPGIPTTRYAVAVAFVGHHFTDENSLRCRTLSLSYPYLLDWTGLNVFAVRHFANEQGHFTGAQVDYSLPEVIRARIEGAEITFDYKFQLDGNTPGQIALQQNTFIKITPADSQPFDTLWSHFRYHLENYFTFAVGTPLYPLEIVITNDNAIEKQGDETQGYTEIEVLLPTAIPPEAERLRHPIEMLFHFSDVSDRFDASLKAWFEKAERLDPVYDLYFGIRYNSQLNLSHQFLNLAQALEVLHRRVFGGWYLPPQEFNSILEGLFNALPHEIHGAIRDTFRQKLRYLNEFSLRKRLQELLNDAGEAIASVIPDIDGFVERMVNMRNYLTHYDPKLSQNRLEHRTFFLLVQQARFLLELRLLMELGFPRELVQTLVRRNHRYDWIRAQITREVR